MGHLPGYFTVIWNQAEVGGPAQPAAPSTGDRRRSKRGRESMADPCRDPNLRKPLELARAPCSLCREQSETGLCELCDGVQQFSVTAKPPTSLVRGGLSLHDPRQCKLAAPNPKTRMPRRRGKALARTTYLPAMCQNFTCGAPVCTGVKSPLLIG
ncbi:hypothetical protein ON010_g9592 [Phytophthora cinnamomi]|nr:hypothetical protein ON010_g9592 [Phytophthora cinnamomi]